MADIDSDGFASLLSRIQVANLTLLLLPKHLPLIELAVSLQNSPAGFGNNRRPPCYPQDWISVVACSYSVASAVALQAAACSSLHGRLDPAAVFFWSLQPVDTPRLQIIRYLQPCLGVHPRAHTRTSKHTIHPRPPHTLQKAPACPHHNPP